MGSLSLVEEQRILNDRRKSRAYRVASALALVIAIVMFLSLGASRFGGESAEGYEMNVVTEGLGVLVSTGITVFLVDWLNDRRAQQRLKRQLVYRASSRANVVALSAVESLSHELWLRESEGALQGAGLYGANLQDAPLVGANLHGTILQNANLKGANLFDADLSWAYVPEADLRCAILLEANLNEAEIWDTDLRGAILWGADLTSATFIGPGLDRRDNADQHTIMPNGCLYNTELDLGQFTDTRHKDFDKTMEEINRIRSQMGYEVWGNS